MTSEPTPYDLACASCEERFDALTANWCNCIGTDSSFVCPICKSCFCRATRAFKQEFWSGAPQGLWDRRTAHRQVRREDTRPVEGAPSPTRPLVLIVDDSPIERFAAAQIVQEWGYRVETAADGAAGLAAARTLVPALVLTDALMPKLDGRELCRQLKSDPLTRTTKVVIMTSLYTSPSQKAEALRRFDADEVSTKPLDVTDLEKILNRLLD